jgi:hypothetical protein
VAWGGGLSGTLPSALNGSAEVTRVFTQRITFVAEVVDVSGVGSGIVVWGQYLPDAAASHTVAVNGIQDVASTSGAIAVLLKTGGVVAWGAVGSGGSTNQVSHQLINVQRISANNAAFAALLMDGSVVTWGAVSSGGSSYTVRPFISDNVVFITSQASPYMDAIYTRHPTLQPSVPSVSPTGVPSHQPSLSPVPTADIGRDDSGRRSELSVGIWRITLICLLPAVCVMACTKLFRCMNKGGAAVSDSAIFPLASAPSVEMAGAEPLGPGNVGGGDYVRARPMPTTAATVPVTSTVAVATACHMSSSNVVVDVVYATSHHNSSGGVLPVAEAVPV